MPDFGCLRNFALSWAGKATTGTYHFVPGVANISAPVELVITQFDDQVTIRLVSQLVSDISTVLQKWIKYVMVLLSQHLFFSLQQQFFLLFLP